MRWWRAMTTFAHTHAVGSLSKFMQTPAGASASMADKHTLARHMMSGMAFLHSRKVLHLDFKVCGSHASRTSGCHG